MTTTLLPEIAMSSLRPINDALGEGDSNPQAGELRETASAMQIIVDGLGKLWQLQRVRLAVGMDGRELRECTRAFLDCMDLSFRLLARIDQLAAAVPNREEIRSLAATAETEARTLAAEISGVHELVSRTTDPAYRAALVKRAERAMAEEPGLYVSHDDAETSVINSGK